MAWGISWAWGAWPESKSTEVFPCLCGDSVVLPSPPPSACVSPGMCLTCTSSPTPPPSCAPAPTSPPCQVRPCPRSAHTVPCSPLSWSPTPGTRPCPSPHPAWSPASRSSLGAWPPLPPEDLVLDPGGGSTRGSVRLCPQPQGDSAAWLWVMGGGWPLLGLRLPTWMVDIWPDPNSPSSRLRRKASPLPLGEDRQATVPEPAARDLGGSGRRHQRWLEPACQSDHHTCPDVACLVHTGQQAACTHTRECSPVHKAHPLLSEPDAG